MMARLHWLALVVVGCSLLAGFVGAWTSKAVLHKRPNDVGPAVRLSALASPSSNSNGDDVMIRQTDYLKNPKPRQMSSAVSETKSDTVENESTSNDTVAEAKEPAEPTASLDECLSLLQESLVSFNSSAASELVSQVSALFGSENAGRDAANELLNQLLAQGPDSASLPVWTKIRVLGRYSRRARWASLRRALDWTTPPPNAEDEDDDDNEENNNAPDNVQRRRRRALITLLRALAAQSPDSDSTDGSSSSDSRVPAIRVLEKRAAREQKVKRREQGGAAEDLTARRPEGLETPKYEVLLKKSSTFEIRRYEDFSVCSVSMTKPRPADIMSKTDARLSDPTEGRGPRSFGALAGYLFGKNEQQQAMKMTTPVLVNTVVNSKIGNNDDDQQTAPQEEKLMSFVLPSEFWKNDTALQAAPQPLEGSGVMLKRFKGSDRAVVMFGGYASKKATEAQTEILLQRIQQEDGWQVADREEGAEEKVAVAQYNDPFTPPWKRLNEVSIAVTQRKD